MAYENNFYLGYDPLLQGNESSPQMQAEMEALRSRQQMLANEARGLKSQPESGSPIWDSIDREIFALTDSQKNLMSSDKEYQQNEVKLSELAQLEILTIVRPRIEQTAEGKKILDAQYKLVMGRKKEVIEESNRQMETFNKEIEVLNAFKLASQTNPGLTYAEFVDAYNS